MFQDTSFREKNSKFQGQELTYETRNGPFVVNDKPLVDYLLRSKRTKSESLFCPLLDLLRHRKLFEWVLQTARNSLNNGQGITIKFFQCGEWIEIVTDSLLTVEIGTRSNDDSQWIPLVEKAYAKLYDSYASLAGGLTSFTMTDLTGGVSIHNRLDGLSWKHLKRIDDGRSKYVFKVIKLNITNYLTQFITFN